MEPPGRPATLPQTFVHELNAKSHPNALTISPAIYVRTHCPRYSSIVTYSYRHIDI